MSNEIELATETAKATQEASKTIGKGIDLTQRFGGFLERVFGRAIEDTVGLYWTDVVAMKRIEASIYDVEKLVSLLEKAQQRLDEKGVSTIRLVPAKVALPLLEYATVEHEEDLHTLWANLLATGMDAQEEQIHRKYVTTLGEMTAEDASVLGAMFKEAEKDTSKKETRDDSLVYGPGVDGTYNYDVTAVITLNRLGLIEPSYIKFKTFVPGGHDDRYGDYGPTQNEVSFPGDLSSVNITEFGFSFGRAIGLHNP
ncbi:Abi-alpha family protein [Neorhizobium sp. T7_12]|uniref:Abi-alpha family protein n=1 Tax=Neorhizobium sp. T7_12 TaxID=2093832 RepID=UPI00155EBE7A|nr:Abi-alpha family protein [Neorhizobium sp. T7_12]